MRSTDAGRIILFMTSRLTASKVLLVADSRPRVSGAAGAPLRRYRIARIRLENRPHATSSPAERTARS